MNDQSTKQGALPFKCERGFTQVPNAINRHYQYYPGFNGNTVTIYAFLLSHYNEDYGYAFPTQIQVARAVNMSTRSVGDHIKRLSELELITTQKSGSFGNMTYTFNAPIEDESTFYKAFPSALSAKVAFEEKLNEEDRKKSERKAKLSPKRTKSTANEVIPQSKEELPLPDVPEVKASTLSDSFAEYDDFF